MALISGGIDNVSLQVIEIEKDVIEGGEAMQINNNGKESAGGKYARGLEVNLVEQGQRRARDWAAIETLYLGKVLDVGYAIRLRLALVYPLHVLYCDATSVTGVVVDLKGQDLYPCR